jgi:hypothetical protein
MTNTLSSSSTHNSRSTDTIKMSHDDVFMPTSMNSSGTPNINRTSSHYLSQVQEALPHERSEYHKHLASAIQDSNPKEQQVKDFLR